MPRSQKKTGKDLLCDVRVVHRERVRKAAKEALDEREAERLSRIYKALGDPGRLRLLHALRGGEMCVCDLAAFLAAGESAVSHQLRLLRDLALVRARREGKMVFYSLDDAHVEELLNIGLSHVRH
ncbi:ArsR/SmtB family transcription factor [Planctomycetota bacterium]